MKNMPIEKGNRKGKKNLGLFIRVDSTQVCGGVPGRKKGANCWLELKSRLSWLMSMVHPSPGPTRVTHLHWFWLSGTP